MCDDGPGIRPDDLPRIFERFGQAPETAMKGTGLGLAICKTIIEQSGGSIRAMSELGEGTIMAFTLAVASPSSANPGSSPSKLHGRRGNGEGLLRA